MRETVRTPSGGYLQKYEDGRSGYAVMYRTSRFGEPQEVFEDLHEGDADQLLVAAECGGVEDLLEGGTE